MLTRKIKTSASVTYINIIINVLFGLILTPLLINALGQNDYGLYVMTGGVIALLATFDFGLSVTITRFLTKYIVERNHKGIFDFLNTVQTLFILLYTALISLGLIYIFVNSSNQILSLSEIDSSKALVLISLLLACLPVMMQTKVYASICNGYESFLFPRLIDLVKYIIRFTVLIVALRHSVDSIIIVTIELILNVVFLLIYSYFVRFKLKVIIKLGIISKPLFVKLLKYAGWVFIYAVVIQFYWKIGQVAVGASFGLKAVTVFSVGVMLGTYAGTFVTAFSSMLLPSATRLISKPQDPLSTLNSCIEIGKINTGILCFIIGAYYLIGENFITLWLGTDIDANSVWWIGLLIMVAYTIPLSQSFINTILDAKGLVKFKAVLYLIMLPSSIYFSSEYLSDFSVVIFVLGMMVFWVVGQVIMNFYYYKILKINVFNFFKEVYFPWLLIVFFSYTLVSILTIDFLQTWFSILGKLTIYCTIFVSFCYVSSRFYKKVIPSQRT